MTGIETAGALVAIAAGGLAVAAGAAAGARAVWRGTTAIVRVRDAILGVAATESEPRRPGLVERVGDLAAAVDEVRTEVGQVRSLLDGHLTWHGGGGGVDTPNGRPSGPVPSLRKAGRR